MGSSMAMRLHAGRGDRDRGKGGGRAIGGRCCGGGASVGVDITLDRNKGRLAVESVGVAERVGPRHVGRERFPCLPLCARQGAPGAGDRPEV